VQQKLYAHLYLYFNTIIVPQSHVVKRLNAKILKTLMLKIGHVWKFGHVIYFNDIFHIFECHLAVIVHFQCTIFIQMQDRFFSLKFGP